MSQWDGTCRLDLETYCELDLTQVGVYKYVSHPSFEILLIGFRFNGEEPGCYDLKQSLDGRLPQRLEHALYNSRILCLAWNAAFEIACLQEYCRREGMPAIDPNHWRCTMTRAAMCGLPLKLSEANKAARVSAEASKYSYGRQLIKIFCQPCKPTKKNGGRTRNLPHHEPEQWELFKSYCKQDVVAEAAIDDVIMHFPVDEREFARWHDDLRINARGVRIDRELVRSAIELSNVCMERDLARLAELTGVGNPKSVDQLKSWLLAYDGELIESLNKKVLPKMIADASDGVIREALELRQRTSKSSVRKYEAMDRVAMEDGRMRGLLAFYAANRTGREAGRLVQIQNMKSNDLEDLEEARALVRAGDLATIELLYGSVPEVLSQISRTAIVPAEGNALVSVDFSAIEGRVTAWLAQEEWRLEVFRTHGKLYEASASQMFRIPWEEFEGYIRQGRKHPLRKKGKIAELALGFGGGKDALITGNALEQGLTEAELPEIVTRWRAASPAISSFDDDRPGLWKRMGSAAMRCVKHNQQVRVGVGPKDANLWITFQMISHGGRRAMYMWLPSGRPLVYWNPSVHIGGRFKREVVCYEGYTKAGPWGVIDTYGGKLTENAVQGIARDILFDTIDYLVDEVVFHVHDEPVLEVPIASAELIMREAIAIMSRTPAWAPGLPMGAEGEIQYFYRKSD